MTLVVVDQFRTTADSYATETNEHGQTIHSGFPKIVRTPKPILYRRAKATSFNTVAFSGSATTFVSAWDIINKKLLGDETIDEYQLVELTRHVVGNPVLIIFPFPNAVLTLEVGDGEPKVKWREGSVHAFGGSYVEPAHGQPEYRTWYSIFYDAWDAGRLPGPDLHFTHHEGTGVAVNDNLKPEATVKRVRRRFPWGNRKPTTRQNQH